MADLLKSVETYRFTNEESAMLFLEDQKQKGLSEMYTIPKHTCQKKVKKQKGEVIDEYYLLAISKDYEGDI